jgi:hypothetical protein
MAAPKTVTLVAPDGRECLASHPSDVSNLVYGHGYSVKGKKSAEEAIAELAEKGVVAEVPTTVTTSTPPAPPK